MAAICTTIRANTEYATVTRNTRENAEPNQNLARSAIGVGLDAIWDRFGMPMAKQMSVIMPTTPEMATAPMIARDTLRCTPTASSPRSALASKPPMVNAPISSASDAAYQGAWPCSGPCVKMKLAACGLGDFTRNAIRMRMPSTSVPRISVTTEMLLIRAVSRTPTTLIRPASSRTMTDTMIISDLLPTFRPSTVPIVGDSSSSVSRDAAAAVPHDRHRARPERGQQVADDHRVGHRPAAGRPDQRRRSAAHRADQQHLGGHRDPRHAGARHPHPDRVPGEVTQAARGELHLHARPAARPGALVRGVAGAADGSVHHRRLRGQR